MATLGELISSISLRLLDENNTAVSTASIADAINTSIRKWKYVPFWFNEDNATVSLVEDDPVVPLPSDFLVENGKDSLVIKENTIRYVLRKVSTAVYDNENLDGSGLPYIYTYRDNEFLLYYYPDRAYDLSIRYLKDYASFATDGSDNAETNDFLTNAEDLIKYDALASLHGELRQDEKMESYYSARAIDENKTLKKKTNSLNSTGRLTVKQI